MLDVSPSFRFKFVLFFPPSANFNPLIIIDLPAPVSPVNALKPLKKLMEIFLINKKEADQKDLGFAQKKIRTMPYCQKLFFLRLKKHSLQFFNEEETKP